MYTVYTHRHYYFGIFWDILGYLNKSHYYRYISYSYNVVYGIIAQFGQKFKKLKLGSASISITASQEVSLPNKNRISTDAQLDIIQAQHFQLLSAKISV